MSLLFETIRIEDRRIRNAEYHNRRLNKARADLFGVAAEVDICRLIKIPIGMGMGIYKCRLTYGEKIRDIELGPHTPRVVKSLKLVEDNHIDYSYKYFNRSRLDDLMSKKMNCDDILIIKNGCITDTSFTNIIFQSPDGSWATPDTPLLKGTMRQFLLEDGRISEKRIRVDDLGNYSQSRLINCMMDMETGHTVEMSEIIP